MGTQESHIDMSNHAYTKEELDLQYNARATVPDVYVYLKQYAELTARAKQTTPHVADVKFGDNVDETLDIYQSSRAAAPVFVFIHGGYWRALTKDESGFMAPALTEAGAMVVSISYSLAPQVSLDTIVDQVRRAVVWTFRNIAGYGGDPERIYLCGSSAGGHLVGMALQSGWHERYGAPLTIVKGAIPISGLFDLTPLVDTHVNEWLHLDLQDARRNSPMFELADVDCPLLVAYAQRDTNEFRRQSDSYAERWRENGSEVEVMCIPDTHHYDVLYQLMSKETPLFQAVAAMIGL
jgi:arylformamidase